MKSYSFICPRLSGNDLQIADQGIDFQVSQSLKKYIKFLALYRLDLLEFIDIWGNIFCMDDC